MVVRLTDSNSHHSETLERTSPDFLIVILDLNAVSWQHIQALTPEQRADAAFSQLQPVLKSVLVFLNAHTAMQHGNGLAVYGAAAGTARLLYTTSSYAQLAPTAENATRVSKSLPFKQVDDAVFAGSKDMLTAEHEAGPIGIVRALSLALCQINRQNTALNDFRSITLEHRTSRVNPGMSGALPGQLSSVSFQYRILALSVSSDVSAQYVPMMNCIFSAQKNNISIVVCKLFGDESVFLRQACYLTGGRYHRLTHLEELLQVLMTVFLPSRAIRGELMAPANDDVDFRAACFCHRKNVDIGYVCSVCLSSMFNLIQALTQYFAARARNALSVAPLFRL